MSREASDMSNTKTHDAQSIRRELAKSLRKYLPQNEQPVVASAPAVAPQVAHDAASVRKHLVSLVKKTIESHASEMAALRARELRKTGTETASGHFDFAKAAEVVDMKGNRKTLGAVTPKPAEPTKPVGMDEGSGGVIIPGKKAMKKAEPPMAKPPSGSVPGKTTPQSQPGGAPASGAPKSSAMPMGKGEMCSHGMKKGEACAKCDADGDNDGDKPAEMKKGDFGMDDSGKVATTFAQAAGSSNIKAAALKPKTPMSAAGIRGTSQFKIKMPGRDGTAGLVSPKMGAPAPAPAAAPGAAPAAGGVKVPRPALPIAPLGRVTGK